MSDKEKELIEKIAQLPEDLQERFLYQAMGAAIALDVMATPDEEKDKSA